MWNQKYDTNEPIYETEIDSQAQRTDLWGLMGRELGEGWSGRLGLANVSYYIYIYIYMNDKQQSPTVQDGELYFSIL